MKYYDYYDFDDEINIAVREYNVSKPDIKSLQEEINGYRKENEGLLKEQDKETDSILKRKCARKIDENLQSIREKEEKIAEMREKIEAKIKVADEKLKKKLQEKDSKIAVSESNVRNIQKEIRYVATEIDRIKKAPTSTYTEAMKQSMLPGLEERKSEYEKMLEEQLEKSETLAEEKKAIEGLHSKFSYLNMENFIKLWDEVTRETKNLSPSSHETPGTPGTPGTQNTPGTPGTQNTPGTSETPPVPTPEFIKKMKEITIGKEGLFIGDEQIEDSKGLKAVYKECSKKGDELYYKEDILDDIMRIEENKVAGYKFPDEIIKSMDPNVLEAIAEQRKQDILTQEEAIQCLSMYASALNGDKGSQEMLKDVIIYDRRGIDLIKPSNIFERIFNGKAFKEFRRYADGHKDLVTTIKDIPGKIRGAFKKTKDPALLTGQQPVQTRRTQNERTGFVPRTPTPTPKSARAGQHDQQQPAQENEQGSAGREPGDD